MVPGESGGRLVLVLTHVVTLELKFEVERVTVLLHNTGEKHAQVMQPKLKSATERHAQVSYFTYIIFVQFCFYLYGRKCA